MLFANRSGRMGRKTKSRPCDGPCIGLTPEELQRTHERMELYDASEPQIRALVQEYGLALTMAIARQFYGRWDEAKEALEAERKLLQLVRSGNTR